MDLTEEEALRNAQLVREKLELLKASLAGGKKKKKRKRESGSVEKPVEENKIEVPKKRPVDAVEEGIEDQTQKKRKIDTGEEKKTEELGRNETRPNPYLAHIRGEPDEKEDSFLRDPRMNEEGWEHKKYVRDKKAFKLVPQGKFSKTAEIQRAREAHKQFLQDRKNLDNRQHLKNLLGRITKKRLTSNQHQEGEAKVVEAESSGQSKVDIAKLIQRESAPPTLEWWDCAFLPVGESAASEEHTVGSLEKLDIENQKAFAFVERPAMLDRLVPEAEARPIKLYLTKDEQKRKRRQMRREQQQETRDKIAAGLLPPPPPRLTHNNVMRILGDEAVADPSKIAALVESLRQDRIRDHEMKNLANKKTPQEKWDKKLEKIADDQKNGITVAVYYVHELVLPDDLCAQNRFKMAVNAQKNGLTGCAVIVDGLVEKRDGSSAKCNVVVVEGGPKFLTKFEHQMLKRIKFPAPPGLPKSGCSKVWQGLAAKKSFPQHFELQEFESGSQARNFLDKLGVPQYWDMCLAIAPSQASS